jgi:two-component system sensor histidine kinase KdpD
VAPPNEERRPDPERLLRQVMAQERQAARERLKVFLGYASGAGKSLRMFDEARRRHERGQDVVAGALQPQRSPELDAMLEHIDVIPLRDGALDVEAILRRKPGVCVVDGLAYDNPPGSRHRQRWEDVEELVSGGITVITSLNIQHIEEEREEVERITGKRAASVVPKRFLTLADEIVVVDVPSEMLPDRAHPLATLREMTLLLVAEVVDRQLEDYLDSHGVDRAWGVHERFMVCVTPRANAARMLESGKRNADRFHGDLLAVYVEQSGLRLEDQERIERILESAHTLGAQVHRLQGEDPIAALLDFAHSQRVTQIFVGHTLRRNWRSHWTGGPLDRLIRDAGDIDVHVFPH